jgi:hypothetical protein
VEVLLLFSPTKVVLLDGLQLSVYIFKGVTTQNVSCKGKYYHDLKAGVNRGTAAGQRLASSAGGSVLRRRAFCVLGTGDWAALTADLDSVANNFPYINFVK